MKKKVVIFMLTLLPLSGCEKKESKSEVISDTSANLEVSERKIEEKRAKGDTICLSQEVLANVLPESIEGFSAIGKSSGQTTEDEIASWTVVERSYKNGDQTMVISLADYNGAYGLYAGATAIFENTEKTDNENGHIQIIRLKEGRYKARESYDDESREANIIAGIDDRFVVTLRATNQKDTENIRSIFEHLELEKLKAE